MAPRTTDTPNLAGVIGYERERARLQASIEEGIKFILIEGALGAGKTTLIRESMEKNPGLRVIVGDRQHLIDAIEDKYSNGLPQVLYRRVTGTRTNPISFLEKFRGKLILYFDENRGVEETALDIKNAVTDNPNLQAVYALTPEQKVKLFTAYPEFANRFNATAHLSLTGLSREDAIAFLKANATLPFDEQAIEFVVEKKYPQELLDEIKSLEVLAKENNAGKVTGELLKEYKPTVQILATRPAFRTTSQEYASSQEYLPPLGRDVLAIVNQRAPTGGVEPIEIARELGKDSGSIRVSLVKLKKANLITKIGKKIVPYHAMNQSGLGP